MSLRGELPRWIGGGALIGVGTLGVARLVRAVLAWHAIRRSLRLLERMADQQRLPTPAVVEIARSVAEATAPAPTATVPAARLSTEQPSAAPTSSADPT